MPGWIGGTDRRMDQWTNKKSPHSTGLRGHCPASPMKTREVEQGKGTADHPLGYLLMGKEVLWGLGGDTLILEES